MLARRCRTAELEAQLLASEAALDALKEAEDKRLAMEEDSMDRKREAMQGLGDLGSELEHLVLEAIKVGARPAEPGDEDPEATKGFEIRDLLHASHRPNIDGILEQLRQQHPRPGEPTVPLEAVIEIYRDLAEKMYAVRAKLEDISFGFMGDCAIQ